MNGHRKVTGSQLRLTCRSFKNESVEEVKSMRLVLCF